MTQPRPLSSFVFPILLVGALLVVLFAPTAPGPRHGSLATWESVNAEDADAAMWKLRADLASILRGAAELDDNEQRAEYIADKTLPRWLSLLEGFDKRLERDAGADDELAETVLLELADGVAGRP